MDMKLEAGDDPNTKFKLKDNKAGGEIFWDNNTGQPAESRINSKMSFEITANSMTVEQTVTTTSTMKRRRRRQCASCNRRCREGRLPPRLLEGRAVREVP